MKFFICILSLCFFSCEIKKEEELIDTVKEVQVLNATLQPKAKQEKKYTPYEQSLLNKGFVDVENIDGVLVNLPYATDQNFVGEVLYDSLQNALLRPIAFEKLQKAQTLLASKNKAYSILIFDAFRPNAVQHKMWDIVKGTDMERYVASPWAGSFHNYGIAIDCTIYDHHEGALLDMGTEYDDLSTAAQYRYNDQLVQDGTISEQARGNRILLRTIMKEAGFQPINSEWWHFNALSKEETRKRFTIE